MFWSFFHTIKEKKRRSKIRAPVLRFLVTVPDSFCAPVGSSRDATLLFSRCGQVKEGGSDDTRIRDCFRSLEEKNWAFCLVTHSLNFPSSIFPENLILTNGRNSPVVQLLRFPTVSTRVSPGWTEFGLNRGVIPSVNICCPYPGLTITRFLISEPWSLLCPLAQQRSPSSAPGGTSNSCLLTGIALHGLASH